ncbi:hypothetical protein A2U01_0101974, partial [Trifolium medium]|nr:hypothetical protein [Trifolium medium]
LNRRGLKGSCKRCGEQGHNKATCKLPPPPPAPEPSTQPVTASQPPPPATQPPPAARGVKMDGLDGFGLDC